MVLVETPNWQAVQGVLQRYQWDVHHWVKVGKPIPVVVGKKGMAWGVEMQFPDLSGPKQKEEGNRTPAGIYEIGPAFGFQSVSMKLPFVTLKETHICVDDVKSRYYNQLIDNVGMKNPDWHSGEKMRQINQYQLGAVIQYNPHNIPGAGSCIFLHIWKSPTSGTAGCVAMSASNLKTLLTWLDPKLKPIIVLLPKE